MSQNDYLVDFLHSDSFWIDIIAMGVKVWGSIILSSTTADN